MLQEMRAVPIAVPRSRAGHAPSFRSKPAGETRPTFRERTGSLHRWLARYSVTLLRISMGIIILMFGIVKFFPGVSPAENLVMATTHLLTFGLIPDHVALLLTATLETFIGISLLTGQLPRVTVCLQAMWLAGILSPIVLLPQRLFSGPGHAPSMEGQYVLKDIILVAACIVLATSTVRRQGVEP